MRRKYVGMIAAATHAIPVERPQDLKVTRPGKFTTNGKTVTGIGTKFTEGIEPKSSVWWRGDCQVIESIVSDTCLMLKHPFPKDIIEPYPFKTSPKLDQTEVFAAVHDALNNGCRVGIFPEGGSHDRTELLPLKAGVTIMALGAEAKYPGLGVKIVPVGLNYYHPNRFRSRAYVEFGQPMDVPADLIKRYTTGSHFKTQHNQIHRAKQDSTAQHNTTHFTINTTQ
jgi:glycerol-3-phosphate O-acyltransferase/dihydroxyacetone phosphate acyltransferase